MTNFHLVVAVEQWLPWLRIEGGKNNLILKGPMRKVLDHMQSRIGFNCTLKRSADSRWGSKLRNMNYSGMIGMLQRKEADLALGPFAITEDRFEVADFSSPIYLDSMAILSRQSISKGTAFNLLNIFTIELWISITVALIIVCFISSLLNIFSYLKYSTSRTVVQFYASLLSQSIKLPQATHLKLLFGFWLYFSFIFLSCFNCQILSSLVTLTTDNVNNFQDLVKTKMIPVIESGGAIERILEYQSDAETSVIRQRIDSNSDTRLTYAHLQSVSTLVKVYRRSHSIVTESSTVRSILSIQARRDKKDVNNDNEVDCDFHVSKDPFNFFILAIAFRRDLDVGLSADIKNTTTMLMESGMVLHWLKEFTVNATECLIRGENKAENRGKNDPIPLTAFTGTFELWSVGVLASCLGFVSELVLSRFNRRRKESCELEKALRAVVSVLTLQRASCDNSTDLKKSNTTTYEISHQTDENRS